MKNMSLLQSETLRAKDPELQEQYKTAYPADLIVAILMEVAGPCSNERMQEVISFLNSQYQQLGDEFNYEPLKVKSPDALETFFTVYATTIAFQDRNLNWNVNVLKHVVHLGLIQIFVHATTDKFVPAEQEEQKLIKLLKHAHLKLSMIVTEVPTQR